MYTPQSLKFPVRTQLLLQTRFWLFSFFHFLCGSLGQSAAGFPSLDQFNTYLSVSFC